MFSDPLDAHKDTAGATPATRAYDRLPAKKIGETIYQAATHNVGNAELIRIAHMDVGSGSKARKRHLVEVSAPPQDSASTDDHSRTWAKIQMVIDIPNDFNDYSDAKIETMFEQFTGLIRGNSVNDATVAIDYDEFFRPFLAGQA